MKVFSIHIKNFVSWYVSVIKKNVDIGLWLENFLKMTSLKTSVLWAITNGLIKNKLFYYKKRDSKVKSNIELT